MEIGRREETKTRGNLDVYTQQATVYQTKK
jgi:hypothetical protein